MQYRITLEPSRRSFSVHAKESILTAGLRAGINLHYRCDNGSCGECASRLIKGNVKALKQPHYRFGEEQKSQGYFLPCICIARSDIVMQAAEHRDATEIPYQEIKARIRKIQPAKENILIIQLRTPRTQTLQFLAGQTVTLELSHGAHKTLAVASCPCNGRLLEFHVRHSGDEFCEYLFNGSHNNEEVLVKGPGGQFILDEESGRVLIFIAYDTGFAGIKSLIEHVLALEMSQDIYLYRIAFNHGENYMNNICRSWDDAIDNFHYHTFEHYISMDFSSEKNAEICRSFIPELEKNGNRIIFESDIYLSGIKDIVSNIGNALLDKGLGRNRLFMQEI